MATKKSYITDDLEFAEIQLATWKRYVLDNPIDSAIDRRGEKEMPNGQIVKNAIIATKEQVIKSTEEMFERYLRLLPVIDELRTKEDAKQSKVRGNVVVPARMENE